MMIHKSELEKAMLQSRANTYSSLERLVAIIPKDHYETIAKTIDAGLGVIDEYEKNLKEYLGVKPNTKEEEWLKTVL